MLLQNHCFDFGSGALSEMGATALAKTGAGQLGLKGLCY
jgi:hypothetical protein